MIDFKTYDAENPKIWEAFKSCAFTAKYEKGLKHFSANGIFEIIRWHMDVEQRGKFKVNNNFRPDYARKMMREFPDFSGFFRLRKLKAGRA